MKRLMVLVAMLAMMLAFAAPAFAFSINAGDDVVINDSGDVEFNAVGQNLIGSVGNIDTGNTATATAIATTNVNAHNSAVSVDNSATASISQDSGVSISQSNVVGNGFFHWGWWF